MKPVCASLLPKDAPGRGSPSASSPRARIGLALGILGVAVLFAGLRWNNYDAPLVRDEGEYAYSAQLLRHGLAPYEESFLQKPPMVVYDYALAGLLAPNTFWFPRLLSGLSAAFATLLLGLVAGLELGRTSVLPAMWCFTPMILLPELNQFIANTEMFMLAPLMATIVIFIFYRRRGSIPACFAAGLLGALTFWHKYSVLPVLAVVFVSWSVYEWRREPTARLQRSCKSWLVALIGAAAGSLAALGFFLLRDGGAHLWECTVQFNSYYLGSADFGLRHLSARLHWFWTNWWILFALPVVLLVRPPRKLWFWFAAFAAAWLGTGLSHYAHYYILIMPFWAFLAAAAIDRLANWAAERLSWSRVWVSRLATGAVVLVLCLSDLPWLAWSRERFAVEKLPWLPLAESLVVGRRIAEIASPQDYVYVAGSEPQILCYAHRFSPTRFDIAYPLTIPTPLAQRYQREAVSSLQQHPPAVVVLVRASSSWMRQRDSLPEFFAFLDHFLATQYDVTGGYIVTPEARGWREPLPSGDLPNTTLVLYQRKPHSSARSLAAQALDRRLSF